MTTELVLLIAVYAFILMGIFLGDDGPMASFMDSGPKLAARVERNISVGRGFKRRGVANEWKEPPGGVE